MTGVAPTPRTAGPHRQLRRSKPGTVAAASLIGTTIEYYDFSVYAMAASLALGPLFFPAGDSTVSTLSAFASFSVAFVARPLGSLLFSTLGDKYGRRGTLLVCLLLMGGATVAIGVLPTYGTIGVAAPILLVVCRILQGLAVGGEWGGAVLLATEHAPAGRRALFGAFPQIGPPLGFVLAALMFSLTTVVTGPEEFLAWGWRIPFLASIVMVGVGLWVRMRVTESPVFDEAVVERKLHSVPLVAVFSRHPARVFVGMLAAMGGLTTWFLITTFSVSYGATVLQIPTGTMVLVVCAAAATHGVLVIPAAFAVERFGRRVPMTVGAAGVAVMAVPAFMLLDTRSPVAIGLGFCATMVPFTLVFGPIGAWLAESFPTAVRYVGASSAFMLAAVLGGIAPLVGTALVDDGRPSLLLGLYAGGLALLGAVSIGFSRETKHRSLND